MKIKNYLLMVLTSITLFSACKKDKSLQAPVPILSQVIPDVTVNLKETFTFKRLAHSGWTLNKKPEVLDARPAAI